MTQEMVKGDDKEKVGEEGNGRLRPFLRSLWLPLAVGYLVLFLASLPNFYQRASTFTLEPYYLGERVIYDNAAAQQDALGRGLSPQANASFEIGFTLFQVLVYYLLTALIAWRTNSGFGWFTAFVLLLLSVGSLMQLIVGVARPFPYANLLVGIPGYLVWPAWFGWLYLFPNGQPVPRRLVWPTAFFLTLFTVLQLLLLLAVTGFLPPRIDTLAATYSPFGVLPLVGFVLYSQIYRYRYVSSLLERQQLKWFLFGLGLFVGFLALFALFPEAVRNSAVTQDILALINLIFPLAVALAILRYRLFDIDILIRRTLVYSVLTSLLAFVYFGLVILLRSLFASVSGQQSPIAIVISTLVIAALFTPLRQRVQAVIDRRFYRKRYNAQQVLAQFAQVARDEVEMEKLMAALVNVIETTVQPDKVSVWVKQTEKQKRAPNE